MDSGVPKAVIRAVLLLVCFSVASVSSTIYTYDRLPQVKHQCAPFLPSVFTELKPDETLGERLKNELWFANGEWSQEPDAVPLIPTKNDHMDRSRSYPGMNLVSFWVMDVESHLPSDNLVSISGILDIGFSKHEPFSTRPSKWSSDFETSSESTKLRIAFEGVYAESDENGGTIHMCLLGKSSMPDSDNDSSDESSFGQHDQIMLRLRYPKTFSLTSRGIYGQMESLSTNFDKISISSQLNERSSVYQFGSPQVLNTYSNDSSHIWYHGVSTFSGGTHFCYYLQALSLMIELKINLNHKSFVQDGLIDSLLLQNEDFDVGNFKLILRNLKCDPGYQGFDTAKIAAELTVRTGPFWSYPRGTSGLSRKSIFAEGFWNASERELRMLGCLGGNGYDPSTCDYQVSLYFPTAFSIHRRSTVYGIISGINAHSESDAMVLLDNAVSCPMTFVLWANFYGSYEYSKLSLASAFKSRDDPLPSDLVSKFKRTVFEYPSYNPSNHTSLSYLVNDLTISYSAAELEACYKLTFVHLFFGSRLVQVSPPAENKDSSSLRTVALSGYLSITGECLSNDVSLSMEGLYDPTKGIMHLIGCRDLRSFPVENIDSLEHGHDCLIEIKVEYPPMNFQWHLKQKVKISIRSQREKQDTLHFSPVIIWTEPITYPRQMTQDQFFKKYEIYLRFVLLILALFCITYQLRYLTTAQGETNGAYISLVMLCIQVSGYVFAVTFKILAFTSIWSYVAVPSPDDSVSDMVAPIDTTIIHVIFTSVSSEFFNLARKVWAWRTNPISPSEIKVLIITLSVHVLGLSIFLKNSATYPTLTQMEAYGGMVLDLFLLPQIIANIMWRIRSKPLRKIYYIGFSLIRAFPRLYNHLQDTFSASDYVPDDKKLNRLSSDVVIAVTVISLAFVVYIQQRCCWISSEPEPTGETDSLLEGKDVSISN